MKTGRPIKPNALYKKGRVLFVWLEESLKQDLISLAESREQSLASLVREALNKFIKNQL